jgi:hypothetical protein
MADQVDKLLQERERNYQSALETARTYFIELERYLSEAKTEGDATLNDKQKEELADENSKSRRGRRAVTSEPTYIFEDDVLNYQLGLGNGTLSKDINSTETAQRRASQPVPGTHAHHNAGLAGTESLVQNMDAFEVRKLWDIAEAEGFTIGSRSTGFMALSGPAHLGGGRAWGSDFAHVGEDGKTTDAGRFKMEPLPKGTTAEQAWIALKPNLLEQRELNERARNHPAEVKMRAEAEAQLGRPIVWDGGDQATIKQQQADAKAVGFNATTTAKAIVEEAPPGQYSSRGGIRFGVAPTPAPVAAPKPAPKPKPVAAKPKPAPAPAVKPKPAPTVTKISSLQSTAQRKPGHVSLKDQIKTPPPKPAAPVGPVTKLPPKGTKAKPAAKPAPRGTGASRIRISEVAPPSTERHGPFGMIGTVDQIHERQHSWQN